MSSLARLFCACALMFAMLVLPSRAAEYRSLSLDVVSAEATRLPDGRAAVNVTLSAEAKRQFGKFTADNLGRQIEVRTTAKVLMKVVLRTSIMGGKIQIANSFSEEEVEELATRLSSGEYKITVEALP